MAGPFDPRDPGLESAFQAARQSRFDPFAEALGLIERAPGAISRSREAQAAKKQKQESLDLERAKTLAEIKELGRRQEPLDLETSNGIRRLVGIPESTIPLSREEARALAQARSAKGQPRPKSKAEVEKETMEMLMKGGKQPSESPLDKVKVVHPDGRTGTIPRSQLKAAQERGFRLAQ